MDKKRAADQNRTARFDPVMVLLAKATQTNAIAKREKCRRRPPHHRKAGGENSQNSGESQ
jgi:hypothetical protein